MKTFFCFSMCLVLLACSNVDGSALPKFESNGFPFEIREHEGLCKEVVLNDTAEQGYWSLQASGSELSHDEINNGTITRVSWVHRERLNDLTLVLRDLEVSERALSLERRYLVDSWYYAPHSQPDGSTDLAKFLMVADRDTFAADEVGPGTNLHFFDVAIMLTGTSDEPPGYVVQEYDDVPRGEVAVYRSVDCDRVPVIDPQRLNAPGCVWVPVRGTDYCF